MILTKRMIRDLLFFKGPQSVRSLADRYYGKDATLEQGMHIAGLLVDLSEQGEVKQDEDNNWYCTVEVRD